MLEEKDKWIILDWYILAKEIKESQAKCSE
jgi:hypothetical protein